MSPREHTLFVAALGLAAVALAGAIFGYVPWPLGGPVLVLSLGAAVWLQRRGATATAEAAAPKIESGLRMVEKPLPAGRQRFPHGLRVTIGTEVAVDLGLRVILDGAIGEVEALAQIGRGQSARQGAPPAVRESRQAWLFAVRNSPGQRELFLRVDLYSSEPLHVQRVAQIRPGGAVALPEWKELDQHLGTAAATEAPEAPAAAAPESPAAPAAPGS